LREARINQEDFPAAKAPVKLNLQTNEEKIVINRHTRINNISERPFMEKINKLLKEIVNEDMPLDQLLQVKIDLKNELHFEKILEMLTYDYDEMMPFNKHLGIRIDSLTLDKVIVRIDMKPELVGNYEQQILHGGVISSVIDLIGGIIAQLGALKHMNDITIGEMAHRLSMMSTINMRVDYIRPGSGEHFITEATVVRTGNKVAVTRMEFLNDQHQLIAVGTGSYMVG